METKYIRNLGLSLGATAGAFGVIYFLVLFFTGAMLFDPFYKFDFWVCIPFILIGIIILRKSYTKVKVWQGLVLGFYTTILSAAVIAVFYYIFLMYLEPEFIQKSANARLDLINKLILKFQTEGNQLKVDELKEVFKGNKVLAEKGQEPIDFALDKIIWQYLVGGLSTLIAAILLRK